MTNKTKFSDILNDWRFQIFLSVLVAVVIWTVVTLFIRPDTEGIISNVPVNYSYDASRYTTQGLQIVNKPSTTVSVRAYGDGSVIGSITNDDFVVYPDYSAVKGSGSMTLNLLIKFTDTALERQVTMELVGGRKSVDLVFDSIVSKEFTVSVETGDITLASDFVLNRTTCSPSTITIQGPQNEVDKIAKVVAVAEPTSTLDSNVNMVSQLVLEDADGNALNAGNLTLSSETADVQFTVYRTATLPLTVKFINTPPGFDVSSLKYSLSRDYLDVSGSVAAVSSLTELSIGYFDLSTFDLTRDYQMNVSLPDDIVSTDNVSTVTLSFDTRDMTSVSLNVSNINVVNIPDTYQITPLVQTLNNVTLVGPKEVLESLSARSVVAEIDAEDIQVTDGKQTVAAQIYVPAENTVFAIGNYSVLCSITSE